MSYLDDERRQRTEHLEKRDAAGKAIKELIALGWTYKNFEDVAAGLRLEKFGRTPLRKIIRK
jgi:hypothetical protein